MSEALSLGSVRDNVCLGTVGDSQNMRVSLTAQVGGSVDNVCLGTWVLTTCALERGCLSGSSSCESISRSTTGHAPVSREVATVPRDTTRQVPDQQRQKGQEHRSAAAVLRRFRLRIKPPPPRLRRPPRHPVRLGTGCCTEWHQQLQLLCGPYGLRRPRRLSTRAQAWH